MANQIKNLEQVLLPKYLGENREIVQCETRRLTEAGENYGSLMLALDIKLKNTVDGTESVLETVAKAVPENEFIQKMFKSNITFKKELELYRTIVPTLNEFVEQAGFSNLVDFIPEFYGGRLGSGPDSNLFDNDAVILLENLKTQGFVCEDRTKGFDLETSKIILKYLSTLHALPIALKTKKPEVFNQKILPYLNRVLAFDNFGEQELNGMIEDILRIARECQTCVPYLQRLRDALKFSFKWFYDGTPPREPFSTLVHADFWVNNIMLRKNNNGSISVKFVDYQFYEYGSPVRDIILFLFDSVQNHVVLEHYEELLEFYNHNFVSILSKFGVNVEAFSLDKFKEEISIGVKEFVIGQCIIMIKPIFAEKSKVKNVDDLSLEDFEKPYDAPQKHKEKLWMIIEQFAKKGWI